jgi:hypothetical protein
VGTVVTVLLRLGGRGDVWRQSCGGLWKKS